MSVTRFTPAIENIQRARYYPALLFVVFAGALLLRCWPRLVSPQVWIEDGTQVLQGFLGDGWSTFFEPFNGYWTMASKLISGIALAISLYQYPLVSIVLTCLFTAAIGVAVVLAPTLLRWRFLCALSIFLIPSDPEVFGLPSYAFWWAGILLLLLALWDEKRADFGWRTALLVVGGLSSPIIAIVVPLLCVRAVVYRQRRIESWLALLGASIVLLQLFFFSMTTPGNSPLPIFSLLYVVPKFLGGFVVGNLLANPIAWWLAGVAFAVCILAWLRYEPTLKMGWMLFYLFVGVAALSIIRVPMPALLNPATAGPRYFFYPFVVLAWVVIQLHSAKMPIVLRAAGMAILVLAMANLVPVVTRFHNDLHWQAHVRSCRLFPDYNIPVQFDGSLTLPGWDIKLHGADCADFLRHDLFVSIPQLEGQPTFAYSMAQVDWGRRHTPIEIISGTMVDGDSPLPIPPGFRVIASHVTGGPNTSELRLRLKRGEALLYRSGKDRKEQHILIEGFEQHFIDSVPDTNQWVMLAFANSGLPADFVVRIVDAGDGPDQWSAIAQPRTAPP